MIKQFKAGYIIDSINSIIKDYTDSLNTSNQNDNIELDRINGLLKNISSFDVIFPYNYSLLLHDLNPVLATINNIITRGLPTRAPLLIEDLFSKNEWTLSKTDEYSYSYENIHKEIKYSTIFELLHIVEPELEITKKQYGGDVGSEAEWNFINGTLAKYPYVKQIFQSQRDFETINPLMITKNVDFSYEFPYKISNRSKGVIIEFDGPHHETKQYKYYDKYRDDAADNDGFETFRQKISEIGIAFDINKLFSLDIMKVFEKNYQRKIADFITEYTLLFLPFVVARIQKTIVEFLFQNIHLFEQKKINIAIIERDISGGAIAIQDLQKMFFSINALLEVKNKLILPDIKLTIFESEKWAIDSSLHCGASIKDESYFKRNIDEFDIVIDNSILQRSNTYKYNSFISDKSIIIRSAHFVDNSFGNARRVYCAELLNYKNLVEKNDNGSYKPIKNLEFAITYFLRNIFRKKEYREGQLPIISRVLQQLPVIGLLPTGGGKSLTYQIPALLQPGMTIIVDPIKSLMEDQVRVLNLNRIDTCAFINSNIDRREKSKRLINYRYGETQFLFVSPERFVMEDFRSIVRNPDMGVFSLSHAYCVIDEVHCVSEWGHDFRTTYLMLGKNAQDNIKTKKSKAVSLIGLTATASFDVLADIERELRIKSTDVANAIIMIENTIRPELFFRSIDVTEGNRIDYLNTEFVSIGKSLARINNPELLEKSQRHHFDNFDPMDFAKYDKNTKQFVFDENGNYIFEYKDSYLLENDISNISSDDLSTIIFCPVKGETINGNGDFVNTSGVRYVHQRLLTNSSGYFYGVDGGNAGKIVHDHFMNFITGKAAHMVCTKAFGMGIDKANVRATYHYYYSNSLESLVQEAGRSGRDKKISIANILVSKRKKFTLDVFKLFRENISNSLIKGNKFTRKSIRENFHQRWNNVSRLFEDVIFDSLEDITNAIISIDFTLISVAGNTYNILEDEQISELRTILSSKDNKNEYKYIVEQYSDREIHNYFYKKTFKGVDTERSQFLNLFKTKEDVIGQNTLENELMAIENDANLQFIITKTKVYHSASLLVCKLLNINPDTLLYPNARQNYAQTIEKDLKYSFDFNDFLFLLDEKDIVIIGNIDSLTKRRLLFIYNRDRYGSDTGRLIYRMHSMGFLKDYTIDYNTNLYTCTFVKRSSIFEYIDEIEIYLRRYLSERNAIKSIDKLKKRISVESGSLVDNIIECLYFLSEFAYEQIAEKRKRATNEIESVLIESISNKKYLEDKYEQNIFLKEQIFFYFNAKYARIDFKIAGKPFSLLNDYSNHEIDREEVLNKYLRVFGLDGAEQNNYKHMVGSCRKITRSLATEELNSDWVLRLLKAFSMYAVNNPSYIEEANNDVEIGFKALYNDELYLDDFERIEKIFKNYFEVLKENISQQKLSHAIIEQIRLRLLQDMQLHKIEKLIGRNNELNN